ncbi:MAG: hypothetical protein ACREKL_16080, partial [Chthoniobacterales bacterium]
MLRRWTVLALLAFAGGHGFAAATSGMADAIAWYDSLGFPDTSGLPYVRVATGSWIAVGDKPPENRYAKGFLVSDDGATFRVFVCGVAEKYGRAALFGEEEPCEQLEVIKFERKTDEPKYKRVYYERLDLRKEADAARERVRKVSPDDLHWGRPMGHRVRLFAFGRECLRNGLTAQGDSFMQLAAGISDEQTGKVRALKEALQQSTGDSVWTATEEKFGDPGIPWTEILKDYESFAARYPASDKTAEAKERAALLRKMIAEEAAHHPRPLAQMSPDEQAREAIYQLRYLDTELWVSGEHYPTTSWNRKESKKADPVHQLVDLGDAAVPAMIEALDDRSFTRSMEQSFHMQIPPSVLRVSNIAQRILEHISGRNFFPQRTNDGKLIAGTTRQQAEAWWAERQARGEKQVLLEQAAKGGQDGRAAVRKLVAKYPDAALDAIKSALPVAENEAVRGS